MIPATTYTRLAAAAFGVTLSLLAAGCQHPGPGPSTITRSASQPTGDEHNADAKRLLTDAANAARAMQSARVLFSSTDVPDLLARAYAADVTVMPAGSAAGNGTLKINGSYSQAEFRTDAGVLWVKASDGSFVNAGPAHGTLDPAALLDPGHGIAGLLASVTAPVIEDRRAHEGWQEAVKITGTLPASAAAVLVPVSSLGSTSELPVAVWVAPESSHQLLQLIVKVGEGSLTVQFDETRSSTAPPQ